MELASQQLSAPPVHAAGPSQPTGATRAAGRRETTSTPPTGQGQPPDVHTPGDAATPNRERHAPQAPRVCPTRVRSTARRLRAGLLTAGATRYARRMAPSVNQPIPPVYRLAYRRWGAGSSEFKRSVSP